MHSCSDIYADSALVPVREDVSERMHSGPPCDTDCSAEKSSVAAVTTATKALARL